MNESDHSVRRDSLYFKCLIFRLTNILADTHRHFTKLDRNHTETVNCEVTQMEHYI